MLSEIPGRTAGNGRERPNAHQHVQYGKNEPAYVDFVLFLHLVEVREVAFGKIVEFLNRLCSGWASTGSALAMGSWIIECEPRCSVL